MDGDLSLLLGGDVMLGRGIDQILPHPGDPTLAEPVMRDARDYIGLAEADPERLGEVYQGPPALHRYPGSMAARTQELCRLLVARYGGRADALWADAPDGGTLLKRVAELPGFGAQKSKIFVALLGKQYGVRPPGWREASGDYGLEGSRRSGADVTGPESLAEVRRFKQEEKVATKGPTAKKATAKAATPKQRGGGR